MGDEWSIFYGFGSLHDLAQSPPQPPRLAGLKSVKNHTTLHTQPEHETHPVGFQFPWRDNG